ncbi:MAG: GNAT family protein [Actinomycetota bacterium]
MTIESIPTPVLPGPVVDLRPITVDDALAMFVSLSDEESNRLTGTQETFTLDQVEAHCARIAAAPDRHDFAITRPGDPTYLGEVVLMDIDSVNRSAVFRIALARESLFGQGLGTAATQRIVDFGFDEVGLHRIELEVYAFNERARHVYEALGFQVEGVRRDALWQGSGFHDAVVMAILSTER